MNRRSILSISAMTVLGLALVPSSAVSQQKTLKDQLVGIWTLVCSDNVAPDGTKRQLFSANPKGILIFDASGRYVQMNINPDRPKFKINNRLQGTPEENKAALAGAIAQFGTWSVNEADKTLLVRIDSSLFPNQAGTDGKRSIVALTADELKYVNPAVSAGGRTESVWRRAK